MLTCAGTACFSGLDGDASGAARQGAALSSATASRAASGWRGRRYWRVPVMDGEFVVEDSVGRAGGVGGGNFLILCTTGAGGAGRGAGGDRGDARGCPA